MLTTDQIIDHVKRRASIPQSQLKYRNADFVAFMNEAQASKIVPKLIDVDEKFFVTYEDISLVASQTRYRVPNKAAFWALEEIGYLDSAGNYSVLPRMTRGTERVGSTSNQPDGFYLEDGYIVTTPSIGTSANGSLRVYYNRILNDMTLVSNCGQITNVVDGGDDWTITVDSAPLGTSSGADFIYGKSPYELIAKNISITIVGTTITAAKSDFDTTPVVGDWVAEAGLTPIPHLPDAWHYLLAAYTARKCMIGNVDMKTIQLLDSDIADDLDGIKRTIQSRAKGSPRKRVSRNPFLAKQRGRGY